MNDSSELPGLAQDVPEELPLWEAALAWCDPVLVDKLRCAHAAYRAVSTRPPEDNPFPSRSDRMRTRFVAMGAGGPELELSVRRDAAVAAIYSDFRRRIGAQQVVLIGLQVRPELGRTRTVLSHEWANHMAFDWEHNTVAVHDAAFADVSGRTAALPSQRPSLACGMEPREPNAPTPSRPPGRTSHKPQIEAALVAYASEKGKSLAKLAAETPNQSHLADVLFARLQKRSSGSATSGGVPKRETIRKHVRELLASALGDKGGR